MNSIKLSKSNPLLKEIKTNIKHNKNIDVVYAEDLNTLELVIKYNLEINKFLYCNDVDYKESTLYIMDQAKERAKEVYTISRSTFTNLCSKDNSIGFIIEIQLKHETLETFKDKEFILVADSIEIPGNLGTIYRTLDSVGCDGIILVDSITKYNNSKLTQSSRGTNLITPTLTLEYEETIKWLLENNYNIYLGEPVLGNDYKSYEYDKKVAIVVGNERFGINNDWYNHLHKKVYIPMVGNNNSLNVAVAASIIVYEAYMKRNKK